MEKNKIKLSIIILNWNTRELLKQCLKSIVQSLSAKSADKFQSEIMVVDNGSTDGSVEMMEREFPTVKLIKNKENLGYAKGNNIGINKSDGKYIMILNSDTIVKEDSIGKLVRFLDENKKIDIVGSRLLNADGSPQANCGRFPNLLVSAVMLFKEHFGGSEYVRFSPQKSREVDWLMGAAFMAKKEVFKKIGGFDENIFMYMEEVEWFYRAKKAGFRAYFLKEAEIIHLGMGSSKSGRKEPILNIYKGLIYFYKKHKSLVELYVLKLMLKLKAVGAILLGYLKNDNYLKETYAEAFKIN